MIKVENFRAYNLYKRSIDLTGISYNVANSCKSHFTEAEVDLVRKKAIILSRMIASAIAQVNMSVRFKKLNEAKVVINQLKSIMMELRKENKIDDQSWKEFENCSIEVMKLLNGYFRWISKRKVN